jgi:hypothetical protein
MRLSNAYSGMQLWAMVYHTQPGSETVEFVAPKFFTSEKKAWKWFNRKYIPKSFVEPEAVLFSGFNLLTLSTLFQLDIRNGQ